jgi:dGTPase
VVEVLENNGQGLNLTWEVRDGILKHSKGYGKIIPDDPSELAGTTEGRVVRIADIMAYLNHDLDDAVRSGVIRSAQVPEVCERILGSTHWERATTMINDLVFASGVKGEEFVLSMSDDVFGAMAVLRKFLYDNVYRSPLVHNEFIKAKKILSELYAYFLEHETLLDQELSGMEIGGINGNGDSLERIVCDFIASMTDRYAMALYERIFFPSPQV